MNILFIKQFFVGFMVSEKHIVSVFGQCPYSVTFPYIIFVKYIDTLRTFIVLSTVSKLRIFII